MADSNLFGEAGALLQGANTGVADASRTAGAVADQKIKQGEINQEYGLRTQETNASSKRSEDANKAAMERTKMEQTGEDKRQNEREFITMTPQFVKGLATAQPWAGWDKGFKGGERIQKEVFTGLYTANERAHHFSPKTVEVMQDGKPYQASVSFDADGNPTVNMLGEAVPKPAGKGGSGGAGATEKPEQVVARIQKAQDQIKSMIKEGQTGGGLWNKVKEDIGGSSTPQMERGNLNQALLTIKAGKDQLDKMNFPFELDSNIQSLIAGMSTEGPAAGKKEPEERITVIDKKKKKFTIPKSQLDEAIKQGYKRAS